MLTKGHLNFYNQHVKPSLFVFQTFGHRWATMAICIARSNPTPFKSVRSGQSQRVPVSCIRPYTHTRSSVCTQSVSLFGLACISCIPPVSLFELCLDVGGASGLYPLYPAGVGTLCQLWRGGHSLACAGGSKCLKEQWTRTAPSPPR